MTVWLDSEGQSYASERRVIDRRYFPILETSHFRRRRPRSPSESLENAGPNVQTYD